MSDETAADGSQSQPSRTAERGAATGDDGEGSHGTAGEHGDDTRNYRRYLNYAVLAGLLLLAFLAAIQLYFATSSLITTWVEPQYRPAFRAAFNLAVLLLAAFGISYQLRRLAGRTGLGGE